jgi:hypothetical protein
MERIKTLLEDWLPDPLTVATQIEKSLTSRPFCNDWGESAGSVFTMKYLNLAAYNTSISESVIYLAPRQPQIQNSIRFGDWVLATDVKAWRRSFLK